jgi:hypothetical protein
LCACVHSLLNQLKMLEVPFFIVLFLESCPLKREMVAL